MSSIRHQRPSSMYIPFPGVILDASVLESVGVIAGSRLDEDPPKVIMTRADWDRVLANRQVAESGISFLGKTWETNPLIEPPPDIPKDAAFSAVKLPPSKPLKTARKKPGKHRDKTHKATKPTYRGQFGHLKALPLEEALAKARAEHEARLAAGTDPEVSMETLMRALNLVRRWATNYIEPRPLTKLEGEDPPTPTELRKGLKAIRENLT